MFIAFRCLDSFDIALGAVVVEPAQGYEVARVLVAQCAPGLDVVNVHRGHVLDTQEFAYLAVRVIYGVSLHGWLSVLAHSALLPQIIDQPVCVALHIFCHPLVSVRLGCCSKSSKLASCHIHLFELTFL